MDLAHEIYNRVFRKVSMKVDTLWFLCAVLVPELTPAPAEASLL